MDVKWWMYRKEVDVKRWSKVVDEKKKGGCKVVDVKKRGGCKVVDVKKRGGVEFSPLLGYELCPVCDVRVVSLMITALTSCQRLSGDSPARPQS
ncbi:uncharacterized [Tachysurus ichikawai]